MNNDIKIIGVYRVPNNSEVYLIELAINEKPSLIEVGKFTQENPNQPRGNWQVAYDEYYLNASGDKVIGDYFSLQMRT